jgi:hypothetical protein
MAKTDSVREKINLCRPLTNQTQIIRVAQFPLRRPWGGFFGLELLTS